MLTHYLVRRRAEGLGLYVPRLIGAMADTVMGAGRVTLSGSGRPSKYLKPEAQQRASTLILQS
jgi:hypothetical protein